MLQTDEDEEATSGFCTNTSSPISPVAPCLQVAGVKSCGPGLARLSGGGSRILPAVLRVEGLGLEDVVVAPAASRHDLEVGRWV